MIWEDPEEDGNSYVLAYRLDWHRPGTHDLVSTTSTHLAIHHNIFASPNEKLLQYLKGKRQI